MTVPLDLVVLISLVQQDKVCRPASHSDAEVFVFFRILLGLFEDFHIIERNIQYGAVCF